MGLQKNVRKTAGMVFRPCRASGVRAYEVYTWSITGEGSSFKERQRGRVLCPECRKEFPKGSLVMHRQTQHGVTKGGLVLEGDEADGVDNPRTYILAFPAKTRPRPCSVKGCSGRALTRTEMKVHFWHRHFKDTVVILEEGNIPHPRCPLFYMLVPWKALNGMHRYIAQYNWGAERK